MPEGTIFQQNPTPQVSSVSAESPTNLPGNPIASKFSPRRLIKIAGVLFLILTILFVVLAVISPQFGKSKNKNVELSYWGLQENNDVIQVVISDFENENPTIKVSYAKQDPKDYREKLTTRIENGNGPDVFQFHNTWYPMLSGVLLPMPSETIGRKEFADNFYNVAQEDLIKNGAIYGIPLEVDTLAMYVNTNLFDEASKELSETITVPTTWQEFIDVSAKLTKRDESGKIIIAGAGIGAFENVAHAPDIISLLFAQNGVNLNNIDEPDTKVSDALRFYTNFSLVENNVWDQTLDPSLIAFSQGKLAIFFGYYWDYFTIKTSNPNLSFKIAPVPQLLNDNKVNIASYFAEGASLKSKNQKEALLFMKFLAKKETQEKLYAAQLKARPLGKPYGNKNLAEKLKDTDNFVFVDQAKTAVSSPFVDGTQDNGLNDQLNEHLKGTVNDVLSGSSVESGAKTFFEGYSQVLGQYTPQVTK